MNDVKMIYSEISKEEKERVFKGLTPQEQLDCICYAIQGSAMLCMFHVSILGNEELVKKAVEEGLKHFPLEGDTMRNRGTTFLDAYYEAYREMD